MRLTLLSIAALLLPSASWAGVAGLGESPQSTTVSVDSTTPTNPTNVRMQGSLTVTPGTGTFLVNGSTSAVSVLNLPAIQAVSVLGSTFTAVNPGVVQLIGSTSVVTGIGGGPVVTSVSVDSTTLANPTWVKSAAPLQTTVNVDSTTYGNPSSVRVVGSTINIVGLGGGPVLTKVDTDSTTYANPTYVRVVLSTLNVAGYGGGPVTVSVLGSTFTAANPGIVQATGAIAVTSTQTVVWTTTPGGSQQALKMGRDVSTNSISVVQSANPTYSASVTGLAAAASATDIFTISGSNSKVVRVVKVDVTGIATNASIGSVLLIKRSSPDTGGTSSLATDVPFNSASPASTATVTSYTANPTLGAAVGTVVTRNVMVGASSKSWPTDTGPALFIAERQATPIVLLNASETLAVNLNSTTITGNSFNIYVEWTEE